MPRSRSRQRKRSGHAHRAKIILLSGAGPSASRTPLLLATDEDHIVWASVVGASSLDGVDRLVVTTEGPRARGRWEQWVVDRLDSESPPLFGVTARSRIRVH